MNKFLRDLSSAPVTRIIFNSMSTLSCGPVQRRTKSRRASSDLPRSTTPTSIKLKKPKNATSKSTMPTKHLVTKNCERFTMPLACLHTINSKNRKCQNKTTTPSAKCSEMPSSTQRSLSTSPTMRSSKSTRSSSVLTKSCLRRRVRDNSNLKVEIRVRTKLPKGLVPRVLIFLCRCSLSLLKPLEVLIALSIIIEQFCAKRARETRLYQLTIRKHAYDVLATVTALGILVTFAPLVPAQAWSLWCAPNVGEMVSGTILFPSL